MAAAAGDLDLRRLGKGVGSVWTWAMLSLAILLVAGVTACGSPAEPSKGESGVAPAQPPAPQGLTRTDGGQSGVTFAATPAEASDLAARGYPSDYWGFVVQLDTHSVDLTGLDLLGLTVLRDGKKREFKPIAWRGLKEDSHHRSGLLLFSRKDTGLRALSAQEAGPLELVLYDVAGVKERLLRWE